MNQGELKLYIEGVESDLQKVEGRLLHMEQTVHPDLYEKISGLASKVTGLLMLWGLNVVILGFVLYKLFDIAGRIK